MRGAAILHFLLAAIYAVIIWDVRCFTWHYWEAFYIVATSYGPVGFWRKLEMVVFFAVLNVLPFLYLWAVRYCVVRFAGRYEIAALQKDMLTLSEATRLLHQLLLKLPTAQHAARSCCARNDHPSPGASTDVATDPAATDPAARNQVPDDQSQPRISP